MAYNPNTNLNKEVKFSGLSPTQAGIILFGALFFILLSFMIGGILIMAISSFIVFTPVLFLVNKLNKEHKKGNPDFLNSFFRYYTANHYYEDNNDVLKLLQNESRD